MVSLYSLAQQVKAKTGKGTWQEVLQDVRKSYAFVIKQVWFENKKMDIGELDGSVIIPFENQMPTLSTTNNKYFIDIQSSYIQLPQEGGLVSVCYDSEPDTNFILVNAGSYGRLKHIKAGVMGGRQLYYAENTKIYFPRMNKSTVSPVTVRLGCALDNYDVDAALNISPNIQEQIVQLCVAKYAPPTESPINEKVK